MDYAYLWNKASYISASVCVLNYWQTDATVKDRKEVNDTNKYHKKRSQVKTDIN